MENTNNNGFTTKDILILIFGSIFIGFTALFVVLENILMAIIYLLGNVFLIYLFAYFNFKYSKK